MIEAFTLENISLGGPVFDLEKLRWLNGRYIREDHDASSLRRLLEDWAFRPERLERIAPLAQPRMETLADWAYLTTFFFSDAVPFKEEDLALKGKTPEELAALFQMATWSMEKEKDFSGEALEKMFREFAEKLDLKLRDLLLPFYVAVTGEKASTPLFQSMEDPRLRYGSDARTSGCRSFGRHFFEKAEGLGKRLRGALRSSDLVDG